MNFEDKFNQNTELEMVDTAENSKETKLLSKFLAKISERKKSGISEKKIKKKKVEGYNSDTSDDSNEKYEVQKGTSIVKVDATSDTDERMEVDDNSASSNESVIIEEEEDHGSKETKLLIALRTKVESKKKEKQQRALIEKENSKIVDEDLMDTVEVTSVQTNSDEVAEVSKVKDVESAILDSDFQILGKQVFEQRRKIRSVLPAWLAYPRVISNDLSDTTNQVLNLSYLDEKIKENLVSSGVHHLFPVQNEVIPFILNIQRKPSPFWPRDVCCSAPTGSGKTLAFAVPIVQLLMQRVQRKVRALIILPVNELAEQVYQVFKQVSSSDFILI